MEQCLFLFQELYLLELPLPEIQKRRKVNNDIGDDNNIGQVLFVHCSG